MKNWTSFLLCVLFAAGIWLAHNMSMEYAGVVDVPVIAECAIKGRAASSAESVTVSARCSATGFRLLALRHDEKERHIKLNPEDFQYDLSQDRFVLSSNTLDKYSREVFGDGVTVLSYLDGSYSFNFPRENYKTVPVRGVENITCKPQYMPVAPMSFQPDSVTVYGDLNLLETIESVSTRPITLKDLSKSKRGVSQLAAHPGLRLSETEVTWSIDIVRFVELRKDVPVNVRNVPSGISMFTLPPTVEAVFRCTFPAKGNPADVSEFYVDYSDFARSLSGNCMVRCDNLPSYVIDYSVIPEVVECMEIVEAR